MVPKTTLTEEDIQSALGSSNDYPVGSPQYEHFAPVIGQLVDLIGEYRMKQLVTIGSFSAVTSKFYFWLIKDPEFRGSLDSFENSIKVLDYEAIATHLAMISKSPDQFIKSLANSESVAMKQYIIADSEEACMLYDAGELTFEQLLRTSPQSFLPKQPVSA